MKITKEFLREMSQLIDELYSKIPEQERYRLRYTIGTKTKEREFDNSGAFVNYGIQKDMTMLGINMYTRTKDIWIQIPFDGYATFSITATNDDNWVHGVRSQISEILQNYKTRHDFFHVNLKFTVPLYVALGLLTAVLLSLVGLVNVSVDNPSGSWSFFIWIFSSAFWWAWLLRWLFPEFETEYKRQVKYRKWIVTFIGAIIIGVIGNSISGYLMSP